MMLAQAGTLTYHLPTLECHRNSVCVLDFSSSSHSPSLKFWRAPICSSHWDVHRLREAIHLCIHIRAEDEDSGLGSYGCCKDEQQHYLRSDAYDQGLGLMPQW
eukprot:682929-Amphidinium_carterae.1